MTPERINTGYAALQVESSDVSSQNSTMTIIGTVKEIL